jgi:hypothetical protein
MYLSTLRSYIEAMGGKSAQWKNVFLSVATETCGHPTFFVTGSAVSL